MKKSVGLLVSHGLVGIIGFAAGIYWLPILIEPPSPDSQAILSVTQTSLYRGTFRRDLKDSDMLHWGEGDVYISQDAISMKGKLAPGPDYKLYLSPKFVETESEFLKLKSDMVRVGDVKTFNNFIVSLPEGADPAQYSAVVVWCETFSQFITAAAYQ